MITNKTFKEVVMGTSKDAYAGAINSNTHSRPKLQEETKYEKTKVVYGDIHQGLWEELQRSVVGETLIPINYNSLSLKLRKTCPTVCDVRNLGAYKVLVTLASKEDKDQILKEEGGPLRDSFVEIRDWTIEETCQTRRVWVECFGIPPHAWTLHNFRNIAEHWGTTVRFNEPTACGRSFSSARIMMDTCLFSYIQGTVYLLVEGNGFDVYLKEMGKVEEGYLNNSNTCQQEP